MEQPLKHLGRHVLIFLAAALTVIGILVTALTWSLRPDASERAAQRVAVNAVQSQYSIEGVTVYSDRIAGHCAVVQVQRPDISGVGPSVSLSNVGGDWQVRRIGFDFDDDSLLDGAGAPCP